MTTVTGLSFALREVRWQDLSVLADHEDELFGSEAWTCLLYTSDAADE